MSRITRSSLAVCTVLGAAVASATVAPHAFAQEPVATLTLVATAQAPTAGAAGPDGRMWIVERAGAVRVLGAQGLGAPVLDFSGETTTDGERGMAGIAFDPAYEHVYISYTDLAGHNRVDEFALAGGEPQLGTRRNVVFSEQPEAAHNSGDIAFGPDGMLYMTIGDGGFSFEGDPFNNAQNRGTLLGGIIRIDPRGSQPYAIPPDNPFVSDPAARGEVWAYGLRNPWRFSFDALTGDLWLGDVGNLAREEIDFLPAGTGGANFGWPIMEGNLSNRDQPLPPDYVAPAMDYQRVGGVRCSVTGGYVYRGSAIPALQGSYLFSDFCEGDIRALTLAGGQAQETNLGINAGSVVSFAQDQDLELYALDIAGGGVYRIDPTDQPTPSPSPTVTPTATPSPTPSPTSGPVGECLIDYQAADWGGSPGFTATVNVTNTSAAAVSGWTLQWDFPAGQVANEHWSASITQAGATVTATNADWNATIAPGQTASFGFNGMATGIGNNPPPTGFTLNGSACATG